MHRFITTMHIDQNQLFDDRIDRKCCLKNPLRFLNNNITRQVIDERLNYLQGILLYWIIENSDYFKNEEK